MDERTPAELLHEIKEATKEGEVALAKRAGISQATVNRLLNGQLDCSLRTLRALRRAHAEIISNVSSDKERS